MGMPRGRGRLRSLPCAAGGEVGRADRMMASARPCPGGTVRRSDARRTATTSASLGFGRQQWGGLDLRIRDANVWYIHEADYQGRASLMQRIAAPWLPLSTSAGRPRVVLRRRFRRRTSKAQWAMNVEADVALSPPASELPITSTLIGTATTLPNLCAWVASMRKETTDVDVPAGSTTTAA